MSRFPNVLLLSMLSLALLGGCKRSEPERAAGPVPQAPADAGTAAVEPPPAPVETPPTPANAPAVPAGPATTAPAATVRATTAAATNLSSRAPILRAVRNGRQSGADRFVFEFDTTGLPAWQVEYVDRPVRDCGSGDVVPVAGDALLQVRFTGAQAHTELGRATAGERRRTVSQKVAKELVRTCDFEGEVTWVIGVARPNAYTARALSGPSRLVIDIAH